jgi:hypothetical protein
MMRIFFLPFLPQIFGRFSAWGAQKHQYKLWWTQIMFLNNLQIKLFVCCFFTRHAEKNAQKHNKNTLDLL